jgi:nitrate/nitrite transporter NarK
MVLNASRKFSNSKTLPTTTAIILTCAAIGNFCVLAIYWTIPTSYLQGKGAAGGIAVASIVGAIGSGMSPSIIGWLKVETGSLYVGLAAMALIVLAGVVLVLLTLPARVASGTQVATV